MLNLVTIGSGVVGTAGVKFLTFLSTSVVVLKTM